MRAYPDCKTHPKRGQRKALRKIIFAENRLEGNRIRKARADAKLKGQTNVR